MIFGVVAVAAYEVGKGALEIESELLLCSQRWLEQNLPFVVIVKLFDVLFSRRFVVAFVEKSFANFDNAFSPCLLGCQNQLVYNHVGLRFFLFKTRFDFWANSNDECNWTATTFQSHIQQFVTHIAGRIYIGRTAKAAQSDVNES